TYQKDHRQVAVSSSRDWFRAQDLAVLRLQVKLAEVPAPTGHEGRRGRSVARLMRRLGLAHVRVDEAGNVLGVHSASAGESASPVVILAHLDTVFPPEQSCAVRKDGGRYVGPGIGDNSRGLAGMLALAAAIRDPAVR